MVERCGGAAAKLLKMLRVVNTPSITAKRMRMRMRVEKMVLLTARQLKITVRKPIFAVFAAKKKVIQWMSALEILILGHNKMFFKRRRE